MDSYQWKLVMRRKKLTLQLSEHLCLDWTFDSCLLASRLVIGLLQAQKYIYYIWYWLWANAGILTWVTLGHQYQQKADNTIQATYSRWSMYVWIGPLIWVCFLVDELAIGLPQAQKDIHLMLALGPCRDCDPRAPVSTGSQWCQWYQKKWRTVDGICMFGSDLWFGFVS
jgi:hypothetical protein